MNIRKAERGDLSRLIPLFEAYRAFYGKPPDTVKASLFLSDRLTRHDSTIFLAMSSDEALGFTQLYPSFTSVGMGRLWILNDLYVAEPYRGRGVASSLMKAAEDFARSDGSAGLMLETQASNNTAQALYEARGWKRSADYTYYLRF